MCTGVEIAAIAGVAMSAMGTAVAAKGAAQQGKAARQAAEFNAAVQRNQAIAAQQKADFDAKRKREETERLLSLQNARFLKGGVRLAGTPLLVLTDQAAQGEMDAQAIIYGGKIQAAGYRDQATLSIMGGISAEAAGRIKATGTLLTGAGSTLYSGSKLTFTSPPGPLAPSPP